MSKIKKKAIRIGKSYYESWLVYFYLKLGLPRKRIALGIITVKIKNKKKGIARLYTWFSHGGPDSGYKFTLKK